MVAVIKAGKSIYRTVNYNEHKVKEGVAECISAGNCPLDPEMMSINLKLKSFLKRIELNQNVKWNSVHISLNFHVSEKELSQQIILSIADAYIDKLGFGNQPYLIYQHHDTGHPHIHIVTTNIEADGRRIDLHHLASRKSEPARKYIEETFGLVKAEQQKKQVYKLEAIGAPRVLYGKSETKRAIQHVLDHVTEQYKYTSLPELNAVLQQYNVLAERGGENSKTFQHKGLLYRVLDADRKPVGVPIKASAFYSKPTLKNLEARFKENEERRVVHKTRLRNAIDLALFGKKGITLTQLSATLQRKGVIAILRKNKEGLIDGITYVDHHSKCVFNGKGLGKQYSAKAIQERCRQDGQEAPIIHNTTLQTQNNQQTHPQNPKPLQKELDLEGTKLGENSGLILKNPAVSSIGKALEGLIRTEHVSDFVPCQQKRIRKKKRRKRITNNH